MRRIGCSQSHQARCAADRQKRHRRVMGLLLRTLLDSTSLSTFRPCVVGDNMMTLLSSAGLNRNPVAHRTGRCHDCDAMAVAVLQKYGKMPEKSGVANSAAHARLTMVTASWHRVRAARWCHIFGTLRVPSMEPASDTDKAQLGGREAPRVATPAPPRATREPKAASGAALKFSARHEARKKIQFFACRQTSRGSASNEIPEKHAHSLQGVTRARTALPVTSPVPGIRPSACPRTRVPPRR
jgi:hypothetical protein